MHRAARLSAILERLADGGSVTVADLVDDLDTSAGTIRRDLVMLEQQRLLARTHGGATAHAVSYELPLRYKGVRYAEEKRRIAREAAAQVSEGMAIGLTGGTTATEVARALADQQKLTIVTNALNIASELAIRPGIKLITTGGVARSQSYELSGPIAEASLTGLNLNVAFIGVDGITPRPAAPRTMRWRRTRTPSCSAVPGASWWWRTVPRSARSRSPGSVRSARSASSSLTPPRTTTR